MFEMHGVLNNLNIYIERKTDIYSLLRLCCTQLTFNGMQYLYL